MAEKYRFFDATQDENGQYDREYNAQEFTDYFKALVTTGVMKRAGNQLAVSTNGSNMITKIDTGIAFILGKYYENDSFLELTHDTETLGKSRIDRIVIRLNESTEARSVKAFIKKGTPSTMPTAPTLTQTNDLYEISLAQVKIIGGQTFIATDSIVDERGTDIICPYAGSNILPNFNDAALIEHIDKKASKTEYGHIKIGNGLSVIDGVVTAEIPEIPTIEDATTTKKGIVQLTTSTTSSSASLVPTASALKTVNDSVNTLNGRTISTSTPSVGLNATAAGNYSVSLGGQAKAGPYVGSTAIGGNSTASGSLSTAIGYGVVAANSAEGVLGDVSFTNKWKIIGTLSVTGTKNFEIPHPKPEKRYTHVIRHGAVESPTTGDTLYRYTVKAKTDGEKVEVQLPDYFEHLNTNVDVWVNPHLHFGRAYGEVIGDKLYITCEKVGEYKALVIGTRNDENVQDWYIKGVEREIGESWLGETYTFEVDELTELTEFKEEL